MPTPAEEASASAGTSALLTASQVAQLLGIHRQTVWKIPRGDLPYIERGQRRVRCYDPAVVDAYRAVRETCTAEGDSLVGTLVRHARVLADHERRIGQLEKEGAR